MTNMTLQVQESDGGAVFAVGGRLMHEGDSHFFRERLEEVLRRGKQWIVLDLSGVQGMSSTGLGILISAHRILQERGAAFKLAHLSDKVRSVLQITRLNSVFEIFESVEEAVKSVKKAV